MNRHKEFLTWIKHIAEWLDNDQVPYFANDEGNQELAEFLQDLANEFYSLHSIAERQGSEVHSMGSLFYAILNTVAGDTNHYHWNQVIEALRKPKKE